MRLDSELARRGLADSRESAQRLIMAGYVRVDSRPALKPDLKVDAASDIVLLSRGSDYASRGAYKLAAALDHFGLDPKGRDALDVGASTGGFTDVLLRRGANRVIALDVGYGQLALKIRNDPRVVVIDRTNIRKVEPGDLPFRPDLAVIDVSFISLKLVLPVVVKVTTIPADIVMLVKPQFEVGKSKLGKGGVVRDERLRAAALAGVVDFAVKLGLEVAGSIDSPIKGPAGNREFLALARWRG